MNLLFELCIFLLSGQEIMSLLARLLVLYEMSAWKSIDELHPDYN